jgi:mitochondrial fission protein ELM1
MNERTGLPSSILSEGYPGLENQARGLGEAAGLHPSICRITPRGLWERLPARLWPRPLDAVDGLGALGDGLILSAGGTAGAVAAALRRAGRRPVVQVQNPRLPLDRFDLVVVNRHDEINGPNVIVTRTALHRATPARLAEARTLWTPIFAPFAAGRPLVAVLLGGSNGRFRFDPKTADHLAGGLASMAAHDRVAIAATPSRRTPAEVTAALRRTLSPEDGWIWDGQGTNPYFGLLACADAIIVTADSISMISEAAATDVPVLVAPLPGRSRRIGLFLADLRAAGRIRAFEGRLDRFEAKPLDDTPEAGQEMRRRLGF